jgi:hypothetical protein
MSYQAMFDEANKEKKTVELTPTWFPFESEGQFLIGRLRGSSEVTSTMGTGTYLQYLMDTDDGLVKFALGRATDNELKTVLKVGHVYMITFAGQQKIKGGRSVNQFKVQTVTEDVDAGLEVDADVPF